MIVRGRAVYNLPRMNDILREPSSQTSTTLLVRLRAREPQAWRRLSQLYGPLVYGWARGAGLREQDAADVVQDVFQSVLTSIDRFRKERPTDRFRDWLWTIAHRRTVDQIRQLAAQPRAAGGTDALRQLQELPADFLESNATAAHGATAEVVRNAMQLVREEFEPRTWQAFEQTAVAARSPADVAAELGMTAGAVYIARSRVLKRLRTELDGLL